MLHKGCVMLSRECKNARRKKKEKTLNIKASLIYFRFLF